MTRTVLLIEDNPQNRYLATYLLERNGYTVVSAPDGQLGVQLAQELQPDLILLDIQLPGRDGYSVAADLRSLGALANTPIVAVTSYAMVGDRDKAMAAGCDGYIEKPINPDTFVSEISTQLRAIASAPASPKGST